LIDRSSFRRGSARKIFVLLGLEPEVDADRRAAPAEETAVAPPAS
jgi:hypothetical protein